MLGVGFVMIGDSCCVVVILFGCLLLLVFLCWFV